MNKKVGSNIIDEELTVFDVELQFEKIDKIIKKIIKSNKSNGGLVLKQKVINELKNKGYEFSIISNIIDNYDFSRDDISKNEYDNL